MRIMNPIGARNKIPAYPHGYIKYENLKRQGVDTQEEPYLIKFTPSHRSPMILFESNLKNEYFT